MANNDWKKRLGVVYSTNPDFNYNRDSHSAAGNVSSADNGTAAGTLKPAEQKLVVMIDRKGRAGKQVTLVKNFIGAEEDLETLAKLLKTKCGVGGSIKDGEILIQGDCRDKIVTILLSQGYKAKRGN
ncbi:MAG: translation initiation factor [Bacteroidales bacterium]|jgi:translation initiation factor 1|nr:translation initiation factor [Bacteroidales bacterium]MCI1732759.1 translation initiation factor [Bacteroidales bacterium]